MYRKEVLKNYFDIQKNVEICLKQNTLNAKFRVKC